jgi:hypothetical protein
VPQKDRVPATDHEVEQLLAAAESWPRLYVIAILQSLAAWTVALAGLLAMLLTPLCVTVHEEVDLEKKAADFGRHVLGATQDQVRSQVS